jgi:hypothetical protein
MNQKLLFLVVFIFCGIVARSQLNGNNPVLHSYSSTVNNQWNLPGNGINGLPTGAPNWHAQTIEYGIDGISPCSVVYNTDLSDGLGNLTGLTLAADFPVSADDVFEIQKVHLYLMYDVSQVNLSFYTNSGSLPGTTLMAPTAITPTSKTLVAADVYLVELTLPTPITLEGGPSGSLYWMGVSATAPGGSSYWMFSETVNNGTNFAGFLGSIWEDVGPYGFPNDGAFILEGNCGTEDDVEGCLNSPNGQWPTTTFTPTCTGLPQTVTSAGYTGEYSKVNVVAGQQYRFTTSSPTDFITISNNDGTVAYAAGTGAVLWTAPTSETIRYYAHLDSDCNYVSTIMTRYIACGDIVFPPANDDCANAFAISCGETVTGTTVLATNSGGNAANDVFYKYTGNGTPGEITVSLCGSSYDTYLRVYSDCTLSSQIVFNDDFCAAHSEVTFTSDGTSTYYIMVEGYSSNSGSFTMSVTCDLDEPEGCLTTPNGQWGSLTPVCSGIPETITSAGWTGEYSLVTVTEGVEYIFSSSVSTDFITIANTAGTAVYTAGTGSVTWTAVANENIRFILHNSSACDYESVSRTRYVQCGEPIIITEPDFPCFFGDGLASNGPEDGLNVSTATTFRTADDFTVSDNFTVKQVRFNVLSMTSIVNTVLNFRSNNGGAPGAVLHTVTMAPSSSRIVASAFGYPVHEVTYDLATFIDLAPGTYWFEPQVTNQAENGSIFWEASSTGTTGAISHQSSDNGATWLPNEYGYHQIFFVAGECTPVQEGCLTTPNGQWPTTTYTPSCTGSPETITTAGWTGEYSSVNVTAGVEYIFSSSVTTDFITIANSTGTTAYASGTGSVTWTASANETIRFILHNNSDCAYESVSRTRRVQCGEPYVFDDPDYACYQGDGHITALENGYGILATDIYRVADDFTVDPGTEFTLRQVTMSMFSSSGITSATMGIHADNGGIPGTELHNFTVTPSYNEIYGSAFGLNAHRVEFPLTTPITLGEGTYWLNVTTPNQTYWMVTSVGTSGSRVATSGTSGSSWSIDSLYRTVFYVEGDCNAVSEEEPCLDTPNGQWGSLTPACTGVPEIITSAGWTGEYSWVTVTAGTQYIFSSSINTDFITIANNSGTEAYATGTGSVTWTPTVNETIRFILHNNSDCDYENVSRTRYVLCGDIAPPPSNDDCANAIAVACGDTVTGSTISANNSGGNAAGDVFYKFTGTGTVQQVTVSLCGSSYDTYLRIYSDCTLSNQIAFNDDSCGAQSELTFTSDGTSTYYIMVEGFSSNTGDFVLNVTCDDNGSGYCEPELDCTDGDLITNVTFQEIDNDSSCSPNGYGNYTHLVATGTAGETYPISVTVGSGWAYESVSVWVDYNNNFVFEQNEFTYIGTGSGSNVVGEITIPAGTADGQYRMRVRVAAVGEGSATWDMACDETQGYGETEDYTLQVGEGSGSGCNVEYVGTMQDGIGNLQTLQIANDFPVAAMTQMTIQQVTLRIFADIGTGSIYIYRDNAGTPGTLEGDALNVTPTSKTFVANVFGYNVYDVVFDLPTPIVVTTGVSEELFWVGLTTTAGSEGGSNFWEAADVNTNGLAMVSTDGGITWAANSFGQDSAFTVSGECQTLGVSDMSSYDFAYYPNPAKDILNISSNKAVQNVQVFNLAGQEVLANGKVMNSQINISTLMTGTYVFRVTLEDGQIETFKIIKK